MRCNRSLDWAAADVGTAMATRLAQIAARGKANDVFDLASIAGDLLNSITGSGMVTMRVPGKIND
jgi:proline racemase